MSEAGYIVTKNISALRKNYRNLLRVVTSTHSLIIEALPEMAGFCRFWRVSMDTHHHQINSKPLTWDSKVKGFSLYVESEDLHVAITALENALSQLKRGDVAFKENGALVGNVRASYRYSYRPHCAAKGLYWDEDD